jgi:N-acetylglucosaminyl-diphospho-decaprenol L-rhamnosyltransferase
MNPSVSPVCSVVILNYNGAPWLERCLGSIHLQSLFDRIEVIVADNLSPDGSGALAERILRDWPNGRYIQHHANLGYCEGNNRAAQHARGEFLFFLNNDTWLEPNCLEKLLDGVRSAHADAATPLVLDLDSQEIQWVHARGFDLCGFPSFGAPPPSTEPLFIPPGCSFLIRRELFQHLGGFDPVLFMYADEVDLAWRLWLAGHRAVIVPDARLHHRGAANVNPAGGASVVQMQTSDTKRFYANRNALLVPLKNAQHLLLLLVPIQLIALSIEAAAGLAIVRRWSFIRRAYLDAFRDCWRLRHHIRTERRRIRRFRQRGDLWMLRFLRWRFNRWDELLRVRRLGFPRVLDR